MKTKNLVEATVKTCVDGQQFVYLFTVVVPAMSNYTYVLFRIHHGIEMYPIYVPTKVPGYRGLTTEQEFTDWLRETLSSDTTKKIIANLLAQAAS